MTAHILVVDDEPTIERLFRQLFRKRTRTGQWELYFAQNGVEALAKLAELPHVDLVVTDINMPEMDGLTLLAELQKQEDSSLKAVVISAYGDLQKVRLAMNRGAFDFLTKPIDAQDVEHTIERTLKAVAEQRRNREELARAQAALAYDALHDKLTGLPNRTGFMQELQQEIQRCRETPNHTYAVLFVELQRLNAIADNFGFLMADAVVAVAAQRLRECTFHGGTAACFGTGSFTVLLSGSEAVNQISSFVKTLQQTLDAPYEIEGYRLSVRTTIGVSLGSIGYETPEQVLASVNTAMFYAKRNLKRRYEVFTPAMQEAASARGQLEHDLRLAIEREEFLLHYQPIVDLTHNRWVGFESLVRWHHPQRGMVPPGEFIELAEQTELIADVGVLSLKMALRQLRDWRDRLPAFGDGFVNVNVSPIQCAQGGIDTLVKSLLAEFGVPSSALKLEITESSFIQLESADIAMWQRLADLGVQLCIDDFGTGYSCLSRLQALPIDTLKIDSSFVRGMLTDPERLEIVQIIISMAQNLELTVVAEGIETAAERERLQAMGCNYGQGYFFSKPLTVEAAEDFLQKFPQA